MQYTMQYICVALFQQREQHGSMDRRFQIPTAQSQRSGSTNLLEATFSGWTTIYFSTSMANDAFLF